MIRAPGIFYLGEIQHKAKRPFRYTQFSITFYRMQSEHAIIIKANHNSQYS